MWPPRLAGYTALPPLHLRRLLSFNSVSALRDLDRAAAAGDVDAGMRTMAAACQGGRKGQRLRTENALSVWVRLCSQACQQNLACVVHFHDGRLQKL